MTRRAALVLLVLMNALDAGCDRAPGRRAGDDHNATPDTIVDFDVLYRANCAGCHGLRGVDGPATALANPIYLAIADDRVLRQATASGIPDTPMPAFARRFGGMLTDRQIDAIVTGMRARWASPVTAVGIDLPPHTDRGQGDARRGADVFATFCARCHGAGGRGGRGGSSIVDGSYLSLVSDQDLRTTVIAGRPDLGAPDWRGNMPGRAMTSQEITDVVAWLGAQRLPFPGQPY